MGDKFAYTTARRARHQWYDGTPHPWEFKRVWHLEPSVTDPDTVYAGVEDAAFFKSTDGGQNWVEMPGLRDQQGSKWMPGAGGMGLHTIVIDPEQSQSHFHCHLRSWGVSQRGWRPHVEGYYQRAAFRVYS